MEIAHVERPGRGIALANVQKPRDLRVEAMLEERRRREQHERSVAAVAILVAVRGLGVDFDDEGRPVLYDGHDDDPPAPVLDPPPPSTTPPPTASSGGQAQAARPS